MKSLLQFCYQICRYNLQETTNIVEDQLTKDKIIYRDLKPIENPRSTISFVLLLLLHLPCADEELVHAGLFSH
jgi:hypothetical protein